MGDDVLAQLGLDGKSFKREVNAINAHLKSLETEEKSVNVQIAILEKNMRLAGRASGAQVAQLGQLRQALRAVRADMAEVARGQAALNSVSGVGNASGSGGRGFSISGIAHGTAAALYGLSRAIQHVGDNAKNSIENFQAGGSRRDASSGDRGMNALGAGISPTIQDSISSFPSRMAGMLAKVVGGIRGALPFNKGKTDFETGLESMAEEGEKELKVREEIAATEDLMSETLKSRSVTMEYQVGIIHQELDLERQRLALANLETQQGRVQANQAKEKIGALGLQLENLYHQQEVMERAAAADTTSMLLKQRGMKNIAEMVKTEAEYEAKIAEADRRGLTGVVANLRQQMGMALKELAVNEHNLTPGQLVDERRGARKFEREAGQQEARNRDIRDRIARGAYGQTVGSRADRFRADRFKRRQAGANAAADVTNVSTMNTAKMNVTEMTITLPK